MRPERPLITQELRTAGLLQCARQEPSLGEHLEAIANTNHRAAGSCEGVDRDHDPREAGDGPYRS